MRTECITGSFEFERVCGRRVVAGFDGGTATTDAGALLLRHADRVTGLFGRVASCFSDGRSPAHVVHSVRTMVAQRVSGIALGYEDINDHDELRHDPVLGLLSDSPEPGRRNCAVLAGKSTLNRLEHAPGDGGGPCHRIGHDGDALRDVFVDLYIEAHSSAPDEVVLDIDATDDPVHGEQEGRFFHGYYDCWCYLPLYIFAGRHLLSAELREAGVDPAAGALEDVKRVVAQLRGKWPDTRIVVRGDGGFAREELMAWCEENGVEYVIGLPGNSRLAPHAAEALEAAGEEHGRTGKKARRFAGFRYRTRDSWSRARRVVARAEHGDGGARTRFIVTSLPPEEHGDRQLYEDVYCARGEMENRIKECQLDLLADRTSAGTMKANQLRLWLASFAYVLLDSIRRIALAGTSMERATCGTIRLRLLKLGARVSVSVRRVKISMASACPWQREWRIAHERLSAAAA